MKKVSMGWLSIRLKITLWFSVALALVVGLTYFLILSVSRQVIQKTIRDNLIETVMDNVDEVEYYASMEDVDNANDVDYYVQHGDGFLEIDDDFLDEVNEVYTSLCEEDGTLIYGENPIMRETLELGFVNMQVQELTVGGVLYYIYDYQLSPEGVEGLWLRGIVSESQGEVQLGNISRMSLIILPSLLIIAIIGGYLIAGRVLRPIKDISRAAEEISEGDDLNKRIDVGEGKDELHVLAEQFNEMFERLEGSFNAQQQFVSDASHELRTPVSVILAQCELSLEDERTPKEYVEALEVIQRQGGKMSRLIEDMLNLSRIKLSPERYEKSELDLSELVEGVCQDMALIKDKGISLECDVEPDVKCVGNAELLTRLLSNLISNAYRYGCEGEHIWVALKAEDGNAVLRVKDDGIGIADEEQEKIFDRFYQADTSRSGAGSGLGLSMAREIAAFHGWDISVSSKIGEGSCFTVSISSVK